MSFVARLSTVPMWANATWTDKEVIIAVATVVGALIPIVLFIVRQVTKGLRRTVRDLTAQLKHDDPASQDDSPTRPELVIQLRAASQDIDRLSDVLAKKEDDLATKDLRINELTADVEGLQSSLDQHGGELKSERLRIKKALGKDGQTWNEKVLANAPEFRALDPEGRRTPILSVLNLKGGVGKTTVAANLAAALDALGHRVLLLDLDLQGSLTGMFLSEMQHAELFKRERMLEDFLAASFDSEFPNLLEYTQPILTEGKSGLVPTSDYLAYAETNLTLRWLLRESNRDVRFLLRRELHLKRVTNVYDVILLDCPPLITTCCVNALAASDYLMVPITPSKQATARVPVLLKRLKEFRERVNPALKVVGVLANRTTRSDLTYEEQNRLSLLSAQCKEAWGEEVPQFDTFIRQSAEVRIAEDQHRPLRPEDATYQAFLDLASEVGTRLPTFCQIGQGRSAKEVVA